MLARKELEMAVVVFSRNAGKLLVSFECVGTPVHVDHSCERRGVKPPETLAHSTLPISKKEKLKRKPMDLDGKTVTGMHSCAGEPGASVTLKFDIFEQVGNNEPRRIGGHEGLALKLNAKGAGTKSRPYVLQAGPAT